MRKFYNRHKETIWVTLIGMVIFILLNVMMLMYNYDEFTEWRLGYWTRFFNGFEISGFDPYAYICISEWRPIYVLSRHPLLSCMLWPLSALNEELTIMTHMNCAIFIVAVMMTILSTCSWLLMFKIMRRIIGLKFWQSILLTAFFFSFSHVLLITFTEDHMAFTLPLLLLGIYLSGKAIKEEKPLSLWASIPLLFISTGVTTTNMVKVGIMDLMTQWKRVPMFKIIKHFCIYIIPLAIIFGLYILQVDTTQKADDEKTQKMLNHRAENDTVFAKQWEKSKEEKKKVVDSQIIKSELVTNTEYKIDRLPSLVENVFGEGLILHNDYVLLDSNKNGHRPVLVRYDSWIFYAIEAIIVALFIVGIWYGRRERMIWMVMGIFLFDMLLHVGLNFASADVYIMTAHWAFVIPIAIAYLIKKYSAKPMVNMTISALILFLTVFLLAHNMEIIIPHILQN